MDSSVIPVKPENKLEQYIVDVILWFDFGRTNTIESSEVGSILMLLGCAAKQQDITDICKATQFEDTELEGQISAQILMQHIAGLILAGKMKPANTSQLLEAFRALDEHGIGYMHIEDFKNVMMTEGECLTEDEMAEALRVAVDPITGRIPYEYYIGKLTAKDSTVYDLAKEIIEERKTIEAEELQIDAQHAQF